MTATENYRLDDRFVTDEGTVFLTGIQALARLPLEQLRADRRAGLRTAAFVSGYQGSPLGGYGDAVARAARLQPDLPLVFRPGMNEEYAATAVMGSQLAAGQPDARYDGVVGIWYGKAPGVDRAADALRHAVYAGTSMQGGAIALVGDDPAAKSSTIPSTSAGLLFAMHMPIMYPGDPAEALELGRHAIAMSRATGLWVAMKIVADVADATATVDLHPELFAPILPLHEGRPYRHGPDGRLLTPHTLDLEREIVEVRYELARRYAADNRLNRITADPPDAWIGIVASGITYREVMEAFGRLGLRGEEAVAACGIRLLKMGMPMPFNTALVRDFARGVREVLVVEEKSPNIESLLKDAYYDLAVRPLVVGKVDETGRTLFPAYGALDADHILPVLRARLEATLADRLVPLHPQRPRIPVSAGPIDTAGPDDGASLHAARTPFFCSGCPHNRSTEVPSGTLVGAGIGCHTMTLLMDPARVGDIAGITCMGNEGTQWIGMADFVERGHFIQNLGDGTYFHSGQLAVRAAVAAGVNITYKLLYNGTVAMTGGQDPVGRLDVAQVAADLLNGGVARVLITTDDPARHRGGHLPRGVDVWHRDRLIEAQELLASVKGVTVLIHDQPCAAEARRDRKRGLIPTPRQRVVINHRICEGCGDCGQVSNCLSVQPRETPFGRKTTIDQTTCNLDYSCLEGDCPSFVTVTFPEADSERDANGTADAGAASANANASAVAGRLGRGLRRLTALAGARRGHGHGHDAANNAGHPNRRPQAQPPADLPDPALVVPRDDFALRICGIGGTGVVTVAQVLGTAAMLDGFHVRGLDQIGLSQKAGPVVSDVRLSRVAPTATNRLGEGQADLLLAFDQLVAASEKGLLTAAAERTAVVGSTSRTPTGAMITHPDIAYPEAATLAARIAASSRPDVQHWADADRVAEALLGSATASNILVVGMATQAGCLPIPPHHLEAAIALNGVDVAANTAAFRWGRALVACPELVDAAIVEHDPGPASGNRNGRTSGPSLAAPLRARIDALVGEGPLRDRLVLLGTELLAWGDEGTTAGWLAVLERVADAERRAAPGSTDLLAAVAANLFKLTAYKDEYEVARLMTDHDGMAAAWALAAEGGGRSPGRTGEVAWRLHPPMLRALGLDHKITVGAWATPGVRALARGKKLRGTPLDPFGRAEVRRVERALVAEYLTAIGTVLGRLDAGNLPAAVALAGLADQVRGYEHIKLANVARYREQLAAALASFAASRPDSLPAASGTVPR